VATGSEQAGTIERKDAAFDALVPPGARIDKLAGGFAFTEGPIWFKEERYLLFSDIPRNEIHKWTPDGKVVLFRKPSGYDLNDAPAGAFIGSNGMTLDQQGRLIICEHGNGRVTRLEKDGALSVLADKWEGKRLCGRVDGGGSNPPSSFADASKSAWYRACSHAGDFDLPYGNVYSGEKCVGLDNTAIHPLAVPHTDCEGGYSGLYDMSGNVAEWEDSCAADAAASDQCLIRGGSYLDTNQSVGSSPSLLCNSNVHGSPLAATKARSTRDKEIGFRCCSDAQASP